MMWDFIRDFFVQYIFGGTLSDGTRFGGSIGQVITIVDGAIDDSSNFSVNDYQFKLFSDWYGDYYFGFGDWLSTTATIICMVLISICFILLFRWIFKAVASAFLLK